MRAPASAMRTPTLVEPVKLIMSTSARLDQRLARLGRRTGHDVYDARRKARFFEHGDQFEHGERVLRRRLDDARVAHRQRRADLARRVHDREVVRRDARDDADGLADGDRADDAAGRERGGLRLLRWQRDLVRLDLRVATEALRHDRHLHRRRDAHRRAGLGLHQRHQFVVARHQQIGGARAAARHARAATCATTAERVARRRRRRFGVRARALGRVADHLLGGRVDDVVGALARLDPLAADEDRARLRFPVMKRAAILSKSNSNSLIALPRTIL